MRREIFRQTAAVALATLLLTGILHWKLAETAFHKQHLSTSHRLSDIRIRLENGIAKSLLILEGVALFIANSEKITASEFESYASMVIQGKNLLKNVGAAPGLVIRYVYPLEGNRAIIGQDYRTLPKQWPDVKKAVDTGQMTTSGPLKLVQGGTGLIGRVPVYRIDREGKTLWGLVSSVIDMDLLYTAAGVNTADLTVAIRKRGGKAFFGPHTLFTPEARAVVMPVFIPGAEWEIAAVPENGWSGLPLHILVADLVLALCGLGVGYWRFRDIQQSRTILEIQRSLDASQAISHLGSWSLDLKTDRLWCSDETFRIFGVEKTDDIPGMDRVLSMIPVGERDKIRSAVARAVRECGEYTMDHSIIRRDGERRFVEARGAVNCDSDGKAISFTGTILDITSRKKAEDELRARGAQVRAMARASHDALIMIDAKDRILFWSDAAERMFGWSSGEALGKSMHRLIAKPQDCKMAMEGLEAFDRTGTGAVIGSVSEFDAIRRDGTAIPVERSVAAFRIGEDHYAVGSIRDITDRREKEAQLRHLATTDSLTSLPNRRRFMELAREEVKKSQRYLVPFSVIMFDADRFKRVNDRFGHDAGDKVLIDIARVTRKVMREIDFPGRLGGEEFAVGLPHTDLAGAGQLAERLREAFETSAVAVKDGTVINYTVSLGVASCCGEDCPGIETLLQQADKALYRAKNEGRNRAVFHESVKGP